MAAVTLDAMARGGLFDHVAGGFARYSVDATWTRAALREDAERPGALARAYVRAAAWCDEPAYGWVARRTLDFVLGYDARRRRLRLGASTPTPGASRAPTSC